jgi:hypothetical protein
MLLFGTRLLKRQAVEALDNSLSDIMDRPQLPFGGKTFVFVETLGRYYQLLEGGRGLKLSMLRYGDRTYGVPCDILSWFTMRAQIDP